MRAYINLYKPIDAAPYFVSKRVKVSVFELTQLWEKSFMEWKTQADLSDFDALHDRFTGVLKAIRDGDCSSYLFLKQPSHEEEDKEMARYQQCLLHSTTVKRMADSLLPQKRLSICRALVVYWP